MYRHDPASNRSARRTTRNFVRGLAYLADQPYIFAIRRKRSLPQNTSPTHRPAPQINCFITYPDCSFPLSDGNAFPYSTRQDTTATTSSTMTSGAGLFAEPLKPGGNNSNRSEPRDQSTNIACYCKCPGTAISYTETESLEFLRYAGRCKSQ